MNIKFERRTDRPDADGFCQIHLRAYFDGQRLRLPTKERCTAKDWDADAGKFRRSFSGFQDANDNLRALAARVEAAYRQLRISGVEPTPDLLREALQEQVAVKQPKAPAPPSPALLGLFEEFIASLHARGASLATMKTYGSTRGRLASFVAKPPRGHLLLSGYDAAAHDAFLGHLHHGLKVSQNTIWLSVRQVL